MNNNVIGIRIKEIRVDMLKMSQREFAEALDAKKTMISLYENGKRNPSRETVEKISRLSNVSADYIMGLSEHRTLNAEKSKNATNDTNELLEQLQNLDQKKLKKIMEIINE